MASMDDRQQDWETGGGAGTKVRAEVTWGASKRLKDLREEQKAADLAARPAPVWEKFPYRVFVPATK